MSLEKGVVDGTSADFDVLVSRGWGKVVRHANGLNIGSVVFCLNMNKDVYNSLPEDVQATIDELSGDWGVKLFTNFWKEMDIKSWKTWETKFGGQTHYFTQKELDKMDELYKEMRTIERVSGPSTPGKIQET